MAEKFKILLGLILILATFLSFPQKANTQGASLFLSPGSKSFKIEDTFSVELKVDTADLPINAAQVTIYFSPEKLEVLNISKEDSIFTLWLEEPEFSNSSGKISFSGGIPHPGFQGVGKIIILNFKAKEEGMANLTLGEGRVLADDGKGTDILTYLKEAKYLIKKELVPEVESETEETLLPPQIISLTHPQEEDWYNNNNPNFQWPLSENIAGVSFVLDKIPETIPDTASEGRIQSQNYQNIEDGIWYFHLRVEGEKGWSDTSHYQVKIDSQPPYPFEVIIDNAGDATNPQPNLYFETNDDTSGVSHYKIKIGEERFLNLMLAQTNPFSLPRQYPGQHPLIVRAVDKASNNVETKTLIDVQPIESPQVVLWPKTFVAGEETFYLEGTALPETEISIFLKKDDKLVKRWETFSNNQGEWSFSNKELLESGTYYLSTQAKDKRGAISEETQPKEIETVLNGLAFGPILVSFRQLSLIFALIIILGILTFGFLMFRIRQSKKILDRETKEAKETVQTSFEELRKEIKKRIEMLDSQPGFTEQERKIYQDLEKSLNESEESISKEISDVEKELK